MNIAPGVFFLVYIYDLFWVIIKWMVLILKEKEKKSSRKNKTKFIFLFGEKFFFLKKTNIFFNGFFFIKIYKYNIFFL